MLSEFLIAPSTKRTYSSHFSVFRRWCETQGLSPLPASPILIHAYLGHLSSTAKSHSSVLSAVSAIKHFHRILQPPVDPFDALADLLLRAMHRKLGDSVPNRKEPLLSAEVIAIADAFLPAATSNINVLQALTWLSVSFAATLRFNESALLTPGDINLHPDYALLFLFKRKTDQFREGSLLYLARGTTSACPVALLERLLPFCPPDLPVFRQLDGRRFHLESFAFSNPVAIPGPDYRKQPPIDDAQARRILRSFLSSALHLSDSQLPTFGTHSLRSGSTTSLARNDVSEQDIKRAGGWRSDVYTRYIKPSLQQHLAVNRALEL